MAALIAILTNEPARSAPSSRTGRSSPNATGSRPGADGLGSPTRPGSRRPPGRFCGRSATTNCGLCSMRRSPRRRRPATAAGSAIGLALRGWLALRLGDLAAAEVDARTSSPPRSSGSGAIPSTQRWRPRERTGRAGRVGRGRGGACAVRSRDRERLPGSGPAPVRPRSSSIAQGRIDEGLADLLGVGELTTRALVTCPSYLPWRSGGCARLSPGREP